MRHVDELELATMTQTEISAYSNALLKTNEATPAELFMIAKYCDHTPAKPGEAKCRKCGILEYLWPVSRGSGL